MKRYDLGQYPAELLMTSLVCKVGLYLLQFCVDQSTVQHQKQLITFTL